jgi:hypothetical protein
MIPPARTATARIAKAIQPQGVSLLVVSAFFVATAAPAAAAAPGLSPLVVVWTVMVADGVEAAVVVVAVVVETTVAVWTCVVVTVVGGVVIVTDTVVRASVVSSVVEGAVTVVSGAVAAVVVVSPVVVRLPSDEIAVEIAARFAPPPQDETATARANPAAAATRYLTASRYAFARRAPSCDPGEARATRGSSSALGPGLDHLDSFFASVLRACRAECAVSNEGWSDVAETGNLLRRAWPELRSG